MRSRSLISTSIIWTILGCQLAPAQDDPAQELRGILSRARYTDPVKAVKYYERALTFGEEGRLGLVQVLQYRLERVDKVAERVLGAGSLAKMRALLAAELNERRRVALETIFDTSIYPRENHGIVGQPKVDEVVGSVRSLYEHPSPWLREKRDNVREFFANLEVLEEWVERCGARQLAEKLSCVTYEKKLREALDIETVGLAISALEWNREIRLANRDALTTVDDEERMVITLTNRYRWMLGLRILELDERICRAARKHSEEMRDLNYFAHSSPVPGNASPGMRAAQEGHSAVMAENIAMSRNGRSAFLGWYNSSGHHRNMLTPKMTQIGVGGAAARGGMLFTQCFGRGDSLRGRKAFSDPRLDALQRLRAIEEHEDKEFRAEARIALARRLKAAGLAEAAMVEAGIVALVEPENRGASTLLAALPEQDRARVLESARRLHAHRLKRRTARGEEPVKGLSPFVGEEVERGVVPDFEEIPEVARRSDPAPEPEVPHEESAPAKQPDAQTLGLYVGATVKKKSELLQRAAEGEWEDPTPLWKLAYEDRSDSVREYFCECLYEVGGERELEYLVRLLGDKFHRVRHAASERLYLLGEERHVAVLVESLSSEDGEVREDAIERLRTAVGRDFGFRSTDPPGLRRAAVEKWQRWLAEL